MGGCQQANPCYNKIAEAEFYREKALTFATKFDKSLFILKKLKRKAEQYRDIESISDLEWYHKLH